MPSQPPRESRQQQTRAAAQRAVWMPLDQYPVPKADGLRFRWLRTLEIGQPGTPDTRNLSRRFREGWVPSRAQDFPELQMKSDERSQFPDGVEVAGMLLCQIAQDKVDSRAEYYRSLTERQMASVDNSMFKLNDRGDHGMQILRPQRRTRVTRGQRAESDPDASED